MSGPEICCDTEAKRLHLKSGGIPDTWQSPHFSCFPRVFVPFFLRQFGVRARMSFLNGLKFHALREQPEGGIENT